MNARQLTILATVSLTALVATPGSAAESAFSSKELEQIKAYYRTADIPRERRRDRRGLPPGIAKNLERGKALPPGLATEALPPTLESSLPPAPDGYERVIVDTKILLVETATRLIADVIADAMLNN